eukprot:gene11931-12074_t
MTAAHCLSNADPDYNNPWVEIGRYNLNGQNGTSGNNYDRIKCQTAVVYPGWSMDKGLNDIALCFLASPSRYTPVQLAQETTAVPINGVVSVMGWGSQREGQPNADTLLEVDLNIQDLLQCNSTYKNKIRNTQICAGVPQGNADACQGDSGGPLFQRGVISAEDVQVGIVSYGIGCGRPNVPGVYTDVRRYRTWLARQMMVGAAVAAAQSVQLQVAVLAEHANV